MALITSDCAPFRGGWRHVNPGREGCQRSCGNTRLVATQLSPFVGLDLWMSKAAGLILDLFGLDQPPRHTTEAADLGHSRPAGTHAHRTAEKRRRVRRGQSRRRIMSSRVRRTGAAGTRRREKTAAPRRRRSCRPIWRRTAARGRGASAQ